jgi:molybdopterin-guanine dinucleotide biosynthesis protein A
VDRIQPIVLVGGRSSRFGRDKLREPLAGGLLVDRSVAALRGVFGPGVAVVGECHPDVAARADMVIEDRHTGAGPIGGILSALEATGISVFVLPGDLPCITHRSVRAILAAAAQRPDAPAVVGRGDRLEPCIGLYRVVLRECMRERLAAGRASLHDLFVPDRLVAVELPAGEAINVNRPEDLPGPGCGTLRPSGA